MKYSLWLFCRRFKFLWQRITRGWDDSDTWSLDYTTAKFVLPRLKRFKEVNNDHPDEFTEEGWDEVIDKMIFSMDMLIKDSDYCLWDENKTDEENKRDILEIEEKIQEGLDLFGKYFRALWW